MKILALDSATKTGVAIGVAGETPKLWTQVWRLDKQDGPPEIFGRALVWMATILRDDPPDLVVIEQPIYSVAGNTTHQTTTIIQGLYGIFTGTVKAKGIELLVAPIASWRKFALGHGRLKGDDAKRRMLALCAHMGWPSEDHNSAEAAGIWLWACSKKMPHLTHRTEPLFSGALDR